MSPSSGQLGAGLPVSAQAHEPEWVRDGTTATKQDYAAALGFETVLVEQLTKSLTAAGGLGGEGGEESSSEGSSALAAGSGELSSMLPQALASSVMNAGGLGLAAQLTDEMQGRADVTHTQASGGTAA